jgi:hypothetical protein
MILSGGYCEEVNKEFREKGTRFFLSLPPMTRRADLLVIILMKAQEKRGFP